MTAPQRAEISPLIRGEPNPWSRRILVVDDDEAIRSMVSDKLEYEGYEVWTACDGQHALEVLDRRGLPHLAVVDLLMPRMDGFAFCQAVQQYVDLPVIFLTAIDDEETILRGITYCAEDYVTKPFSPRLLAARVERVLRRIGDFAYTLEPRMKIDEFLTVDLAHQQAWVDGAPVRLTPTENKILHILLSNAPRPVSNRYLLDRVWPREEAGEDVLRVHLHRLRAKLQGSAHSEPYILTERGRGYRFRAR